MMRRKGVPCSCESDSLKCGNKIRKIDGISPDPNGEFTIEAGNGIGISTGENKITIINQSMASSFVAGDNINITPSGDDLEIRVADDVFIDNLDVSQDVDVAGDVNVTNDVNIGGDLKITGDIIQQGSSYETHAEQVYTTKDYIYMREGAVGGLGVGDYSGFEVIKYDGTNDGRLVIDKDGVARVGDVGDEQPLLTRSESGSLTNDNLLKWDSANLKAIDSGKKVTDFEPALTVSTGTIPFGADRSSGTIRYYKYGRICTLIFSDIVMSSAGYNKVLGTVPADLLPYVNTAGAITKSDATNTSLVTVLAGTGVISGNMNQTATYYGSLTYITAQ